MIVVGKLQDLANLSSALDFPSFYTHSLSLLSVFWSSYQLNTHSFNHFDISPIPLNHYNISITEC